MFRRKKPGLDHMASPSLSNAADAEETMVAAPRLPAAPGPALAKPAIPQPRPDIPRRMVDIPGPAASAAATAAVQRKPDNEGKKLIVGRDISLSGNITACDKLVVEGTVEANLTDAASIEISESGLFKGSAEVDDAEIAGRFEGGLTVRRKLVIRATGRVQGTIRYSRIVIDAGGEVSGTVEVISGEATSGQPASGA